MLAMEKERTRQVQAKSEARSEAVQVVATVIGVIVVIAIIVGGMWTFAQRSAQRTNDQIITCTEGGGTMFKMQDNSNVCLHLEAQ